MSTYAPVTSTRKHIHAQISLQGTVSYKIGLNMKREVRTVSRKQHTFALHCLKCCFFLLYIGKGVCLVKRMAEMKRLQVLSEGLYTLCLSKLEPLGSLAQTYMAADQNLFSDARYLRLQVTNPTMFPFACVAAHEPAYVRQVQREECVERNESTQKAGAQRRRFVSLQTGTLDSRSLVHF